MARGRNAKRDIGEIPMSANYTNSIVHQDLYVLKVLTHGWHDPPICTTNVLGS